MMLKYSDRLLYKLSFDQETDISVIVDITD